jgi:hypothetical protein
VQAVLAHEVGAHAREVAFVAVGQAFVEQARDRQAQHGIAQEFQPLVVLGAPAAVRERTPQQLGPREGVAQALLQGLQRRCEPRIDAAYLDRPSYLMSTYTGP